MRRHFKTPSPGWKPARRSARGGRCRILRVCLGIMQQDLSFFLVVVGVESFRSDDVFDTVNIQLALVVSSSSCGRLVFPVNPSARWANATANPEIGKKEWMNESQKPQKGRNRDDTAEKEDWKFKLRTQSFASLSFLFWVSLFVSGIHGVLVVRARPLLFSRALVPRV